MQTLGTINVVGTIIPVVLATKEEAGPDVMDETSFGAFEYEKCTIFLRKWANTLRSPSARYADSEHERVHAILLENGGTKLIEQATPHMTQEQREFFEEQLVRVIAPGLVTSALDMLDLFVFLHEAGAL